MASDTGADSRMEVVTEAVDDASSTRSIRTDQLSGDYSSDDEGTVYIKANTIGGSPPIDVTLSLDQTLGHVGRVLRKDGNFRNTTLNFVFAKAGISNGKFTEFTTAQRVAAAAGRVKKQLATSEHSIRGQQCGMGRR